MGMFSTVNTDLACERCGSTYRTGVQFKTGEDWALPAYEAGQVVPALPPGSDYEGIADAFCPDCAKRWIADERVAHFDALADDVETGKVTARLATYQADLDRLDLGRQLRLLGAEPLTGKSASHLRLAREDTDDVTVLHLVSLTRRGRGRLFSVAPIRRRPLLPERLGVLDLAQGRKDRRPGDQPARAKHGRDKNSTRATARTACDEHLLYSGPQVAIRYGSDAKPALGEVLALYRSVGWSSAEKPDALHAGLLASHSLVTAWDDDRLVGLGNAISDGHLVVYYPHLVVQPEYQGRGIGTGVMTRLMARYEGFHQHALLADGRAVDFYKKLGFTRAGGTEPLWIFAGHEHD